MTTGMSSKRAAAPLTAVWYPSPPARAALTAEGVAVAGDVCPVGSTADIIDLARAASAAITTTGPGAMASNTYDDATVAANT